MTEGPPPAPDSKTKKFLKVVYLIIMVAYAAFSVYSAISAYAKYKKIEGEFNNLLDNWRSDLITDIETKGKNAPCSTGYSEILKYEWPGTVAGCDCSKITDGFDYATNVTIEKKLYRGACNSTQTNKFCEPLASTPAKNLTFFQNSKYCAKKELGVNFLTLADKMNSDGTCATGYKKCGGKTTTMNGVCVPTTMTTCPIMDIAVTQVNANYRKTGGMVNGMDMYITNDPDLDLAPVGQFYLNEEGQCTTSIGKTTTKGTNHPLMATDIPPCSVYEDTFVTLGNGEGRRQFMENNDISFIAVNNLGDYINNAQMIRASKRGYLGFKPECRKDAAIMNNNQAKVKSITAAQTCLLIIAIIVGLVLGVGYTIVDICIILECGGPEKVAKMKECVSWKKWLNLIIKVLHIASLVWAVSLSAKVKDYFSDLATRNCGSDRTNRNMTDLSVQINDFVFKTNRNSLIVACIMILVDLVSLAVSLCYKKKDEAKAAQNTVQPNDFSQQPMNQGAIGYSNGAPAGFGMANQPGYAPQGGFGPQNGYAPQGGFGPQNGFGPQGGPIQFPPNNASQYKM